MKSYKIKDFMDAKNPRICQKPPVINWWNVAGA